MYMNKGLIALAMGTFALGISEFLMMAILSHIAAAMDISVSRAGLFITAYASGVCCGAPALLFARKIPLKRLMLILSALIAAGNLLAAIAPGFITFFIARFISGLPHGAYFGVVAIVARKLARQGKEASAVSVMVAGMTVATLLGVPSGTFISNMVSWRVAFIIVSVVGTFTFLAIRAWVPKVPGLEDRGFKGQFSFMKTLPPWLIFGGVLFGQTGIYCWYSYIDPQLTEIALFPVKALSWLMIIAGFGMFAGNLIGGKLSDRFMPSSVGAGVQAVAIPVLLMFFFFGDIKWAAALLMALGTATLFGSSSPLQSDIVGYCRGGEMLGAACIQIAYNAGNAIAAWIGGAVIKEGYGYGATSIVGLPLILIGCVLLYTLYFKYERKYGAPQSR